MLLCLSGQAEKRQFNILDYGAVRDSTVLQTEAIQKAIDAAARRGGTVVVPSGVYLSGALFFKPRTHLHLEKGAVLKGSPDSRMPRPLSMRTVPMASPSAARVLSTATAPPGGTPSGAFFARSATSPTLRSAAGALSV